MTVGKGGMQGQKEISHVSNVWFCVSDLSGFEPYQRLQGNAQIIYLGLCRV